MVRVFIRHHLEVFGRWLRGLLQSRVDSHQPGAAVFDTRALQAGGTGSGLRSCCFIGLAAGGGGRQE